MRLSERWLQSVQVWESEERDNGYVGTSILPGERLPNIRCIVRPAEDRLTAEMYGERVTEMLTIVTQESIKNGCFVAFNGEEQPTHRIISAKCYTWHIEALAERRRS